MQFGNYVGESVLIITNYSKSDNITTVFKLNILQSIPQNLQAADFNPVVLDEQNKDFTVTCEGQNRSSERILWGDLNAAVELIPKVAKKIFEDFKIDEKDIPKDYVVNLFGDRKVLPTDYYDGIKIFKLRELSMQQAIDLATLLLRLERDMQKYTENIPTVGGNVKIATIDGEGFTFISGNSLKVDNI